MNDTLQDPLTPPLTPPEGTPGATPDATPSSIPDATPAQPRPSSPPIPASQWSAPTIPAAPRPPRPVDPMPHPHNPWASGYAPIPPYGSSGSDLPPAGGRPTFDTPRPRARRWAPALIAIGLLAMLGVGLGVGAVLTHGNGNGATSGGNNTHTITIGSNTAPVTTTSSSATALQDNIETVVKAVQPSVVEITSVSASQEAIGSGDIVTANGYIVTNDHVVQGFNTFTVTLSNGSNKSAQIVGQDPQDDLAVLKIDATGLKPIAFSDSNKVQVGEFSIAVGNPLGLQQSATFGIVSALNRTASEAPNGPAGELTGLIQTSAPINPGNSGGALVDLSGTLIGIPTLGAIDPETGTAANGIGYAIPSDRVQYVAQQLIQQGHLTSTGQGFLGIQGEDVTPQLAQADNLPVQSGVLITAFANDAAGQSPAQQAGLQQGDIIVAVNGQQIGSSSDLSGILLTEAPGTQVSLTIVRGTAQQTVTVTLGERPTTAG